jgi:hypothetical protein
MSIATFGRGAAALASAALAIGLAASSAGAAVTFDPATGSGFVGKGDVQLLFGWNNKSLQDKADSLQFRAATEVVSEVSWICTNTNNENTQEREQATTTTVQGVVSSVARERNQITGFVLTSYAGDVSVTTGSTEGPALNSCPGGPWTLSTPAGEPEIVSTEGGLQVSADGQEWLVLEPAV